MIIMIYDVGAHERNYWVFCVAGALLRTCVIEGCYVLFYCCWTFCFLNVLVVYFFSFYWGAASVRV